MTTTEPRTEPLKTQGSAGSDGKQAAHKPAKRKGLTGLFARFWLVITLAVVIALSGFVVHRLHGIFGIHKGTFGGGTSGEVLDSFNAKTITLEVTGATGQHGDDQLPRRELPSAAGPQRALALEQSIEFNETRYPGQPGGARRRQLDRLPVRREQARRER